jgi:effector-binding domain-containing protein
MYRSIVSVTLSILFLAFLTAPTVIMLIDKTADVSIFYTCNEEEEKKGQEKDKDKELLYYELLKEVCYFDANEAELNLAYFFKNYQKPHLNLISPPPELYIV